MTGDRTDFNSFSLKRIEIKKIDKKTEIDKKTKTKKRQDEERK